jgi:hypothetical protein
LFDCSFQLGTSSCETASVGGLLRWIIEIVVQDGADGVVATLGMKSEAKKIINSHIQILPFKK